MPNKSRLRVARVTMAGGSNVHRNFTFSREACMLLDLLASECQTSAGAIVHQALAPYMATLKQQLRSAGTYEAAFAEWEEYRRDRANS